MADLRRTRTRYHLYSPRTTVFILRPPPITHFPKYTIPPHNSTETEMIDDAGGNDRQQRLRLHTPPGPLGDGGAAGAGTGPGAKLGLAGERVRRERFHSGHQ
jgi:hypothetical protein